MSQEEKKDNGSGKKKKKSGIKIFLITFFTVIIIFLIGGLIAANHFLGKMNYGDVEGKVSDTLEAEEKIEFDDAEDIETVEQANEDIRANLDDSKIWSSDDVYNILIIGYDLGNAEKVMFKGATLPRSDAVLVASINKVTKQVSLVSLSRATYVAIPDHGNKRLNTAHAYGGADCLQQTIEMNYKFRIDRYVSVDFEGFKAIIDVLGGVKLTLSDVEAKAAFGNSGKQAGTYTLNGTQALNYVRLRKTDSDRVRTGRQRNVLSSIAAQAKTKSIGELIEAMNEILPYVNTNFTKTELISKSAEFAPCLKWELKQDIIPHNATKLSGRDGKDVLILDWAETTAYAHDILYKNVEAEKINLE